MHGGGRVSPSSKKEEDKEFNHGICLCHPWKSGARLEAWLPDIGELVLNFERRRLTRYVR